MIQSREQLRFAFGRGNLLDFIQRPFRNVGQCPSYEILERRVALIEAPPHSTREILHLLRRDIVEPFPGQRALAHAADRYDAHDAN